MTVLVGLAATLLASCAAPLGEGAPSQSAGFPSTEESSDSSSGEPPSGAESEFETDFSQHSVPYSEILSGGPPKDGIPPIDDPQFIGVGEADDWLEPEEPVILFQVGDDVRAYPIQIIIWHEIVNDTVGGEPMVVTFCPLCNTAIAFDRTLEGREFTFGTTGKLRFSNLIMYDRQTETWWQQATGEAIVGELTGKQLNFRSASIISWEEFKSAHPDRVLSRDTDNPRNYGENPYAGYDDADSSPFLYEGPDTPGELPPKARVMTVDSENEAVAYPYDVLQEERAVNDEVDGRPVAVFWSPDTASALDEGQVEEGHDVGSAGVFSRKLDDRTLTFRYDGDCIIDEQTGSEWSPLGEAVGGELEGEQLERVTSVEHFWFSWAAFKPDTRVYGSNGE